MLAIQQVLISVFLIVAPVWAQSPTLTPPTCSNPNLQMTPAFRAQILDYINDARNTLKNGQLLLQNGEYALIPETMPELSWDCEVEEEMHDLARRVCRSGMFPTENYKWFINSVNRPHDEVVYAGLHIWMMVVAKTTMVLKALVFQPQF